ncbi:MAG: hypothetical protein RIK87_08890 [Fuerstiella sp.]
MPEIEKNTDRDVQLILQSLVPIRRRLRLRQAVRLMTSGALVGCAVMALMALTLALSHMSTDIMGLLVFAAVPAAIGAAAGMFLETSWSQAAAVVDLYYGLKDRTRSALQFARQPASTERSLQIRDAAAHLAAINAGNVVPVQLPPQARWVLLLLVTTPAVSLIPARARNVEPEFVPSQEFGQAVTDVATDVAELEQLALETDADQLKDLIARLKIDLKDLNLPQAGPRQSLATLSDMQKKMKDLLSEMNVSAMDSQLADVADSLSAANAFKPAADALKQQSLDRAAEALRDIDATELPRSESVPTSERLEKSAVEAEEKGLQNLSETLEQLAESVKKRDADAISQSSQDLAQQIQRHELAKEMAGKLSSKFDALSEAKNRFAANSNSEGNGASADATGTNLVKGKSEQKSAAASRKAGSKSAGNIKGEKTRLDGQRQMAELTGQLTEQGASDIETISSEEGQGKALRLAQEAFTEYQKVSETVLESEPIPLSQRETIRRYFQLIRPDTSESSQ